MEFTEQQTTQIVQMTIGLSQSEQFEKQCLAHLAALLPCDAALFVRARDSTEAVVKASHSLTGQALSTFPAGETCSPRRPAAAVISRTEVGPGSRQLARWLQTNGYQQALLLPVGTDLDGVCLLRENSGFGEPDIVLGGYLASLLPPLYEAHKKYAALYQSSLWFRMISDRVYFGTVLLSETFEIMGYNNMAAQRMCLVTKERNVNDAQAAFSSMVMEMVRNDRSLGPKIDFCQILNHYIIEVMKCRDMDEAGDLRTIYITMIFELEWFQSLIQYSSAKEIERFNLTARELEITQLLLEGSSYQQVAETLSISLFTVKEHIKKIFKKFSVTSRNELLVEIYAKSGYFPAIKEKS